MKKILMLTGALLTLQALPAFAGPGPNGDKTYGKGERYLKMFEMQDADKDGVITKEEHQAFTLQRFSEIDADKDDKITKDEAKAHHESMRAKWQEKREQMKQQRSGASSGDDKPAAE